MGNKVFTYTSKEGLDKHKKGIEEAKLNTARGRSGPVPHIQVP